MAKAFMDEDFLLETETARALYRTAEKESIYDYHCHLIPKQIAENYQMSDLADAWLSGDHYKWRMMRAMGYDEEYITGGACAYDKFLAWARTTENLIGNPLYHWTHLELKRYFGIDDVLNEKNAPLIWEKANALLKTNELSIKGIFDKFNIYAAGTTDDPADSLEHHKAIADGTAPIGKINTKVIPSYRPDRAFDLNVADFPGYIQTLSEASGVKINTPDDLLDALEKRLDYFISMGCRSSDHALVYPPFTLTSYNNIKVSLEKALDGKKIPDEEADAYKTYMLIALSDLYSKKGIVMQLHLSSIRNVNSGFFSLLGANTGFDAVSDYKLSCNLAALLDQMNKNCELGLPKTILYTLNPKDYYPIATIMGGFQGPGCFGKMQLGSAWWFCDNRDGMEEQMKILANQGILSAFVGMLTDSRSFLSYPRHEYFRRIMCNLIGGWAEKGEYPRDMPRLEKLVKDISFFNAKKYFD